MLRICTSQRRTFGSPFSYSSHSKCHLRTKSFQRKNLESFLILKFSKLFPPLLHKKIYAAKAQSTQNPRQTTLLRCTSLSRMTSFSISHTSFYLVLIGAICVLIQAEDYYTGNMIMLCLFYRGPSGHARSDPIINQECASDHVHTVSNVKLRSLRGACL